jgi:hypothetical protein
MIGENVAQSFAADMDGNEGCIPEAELFRLTKSPEYDGLVESVPSAILRLLPMSPSLNGADTNRIPRETKFLVPQEVAAQVRTWAREAMQPDPHSIPALDHAYHVRSLYLDSPELDVFHRRGSYARGKYRIRQYLPAGIVFLERKLKSRGVVRKRRTETRLQDLLHLLQKPVFQWAGSWYHRRLEVRRLKPLCQITYLRYPFVERNSSADLRLTIDSQIRALPTQQYHFHDGAEGARILAEQAIVEMKYFGETPTLFKEMMDRFELTPQPVSKYRLAVGALGIAQEEPSAKAEAACGVEDE